ncbi:hypothetical protein CRYUN_Cryun36dG0107800 [Craigia yunnanensis]
MYPGGLTMLSVFSGIGGAVAALLPLGIHLKGVVFVETSEARERIFRNWWHNTRQTGELVLIEDIQKLTSRRLESLIDKLGGFDFVICQNSSMTDRGEGRIPGEGGRIPGGLDPSGLYIPPPLMTVADNDSLPGFDFSLCNEFVRVLQRVR